MDQGYAPDYPGRKRLLSNVAAGWFANAVTLVIGFVMPRLIHDSIGIVALGTWDLAWSLLTYLSTTGLGSASSITHFVAGFTAANRPDEVRITIATGFYCQVGMALLAAAAFLAVIETMPYWMPGTAAEDVRLLGLVMAAAVAVALLGDLNQGVLNGHHRGAVNELLVVGADILLAIGMIAVVLAGYGIVGLAVVTLAVRCTFEIVRLAVTVRICPLTSIRPSCWRTQRARDLVRFTAKTSVGIAQDLFVHQIARILLVAGAGPVALACYSRYATLMRQIARAVERLTYVVPPMASGLVAMGQGSEIARFSQRAGGAALMVTLPMVLVFGVFGDEIVRVWMGHEFVSPGVAWILAIVALVQVDRSVATRVLSGMNAHGRVALFCLASSAIVFAAVAIWLAPLDPVRTAMLVATTMVAGVFVPHLIFGSRKIGIRARGYLRTVYARPLLCNAAFLGGLLVARARFDAGHELTAGLTFAAGCCVLALMYWFVAFDDRMRARARSMFPRHAPR